MNGDDAMRWMVTGAGGMLGRDVMRALSDTMAYDVTALDRVGLDISHAGDCFRAVRGHDVVVNCAAYTDVDAAETHEYAANVVNGHGAANLADACHAFGAVLLHVSTDYVLSGEHGTPIPEDAPYAPVNAYGRSKALGERAVLNFAPYHGYVVRTAWLYGEHGPNFVDTMRRLAATGDGPVSVVDDQWGQPTWTVALAHRLIALGHAAHREDVYPGIYHATSTGRTTWYALARKVFELTGHDPERVVPVTSAEFKRPAARPAWSVLGHDTWEFTPMGRMDSWELMLREYLASEGLLQSDA